MKRSVLILVVILVLVVILSAWFLLRAFIFTSPNPPLAEQVLRVGAATFTVEIADTEMKRVRGLSNRQSLSAGHGMLFIFPRPASYGFWMKDTYIPLDLVWISGARVTGVTANVPPAGTAGTSSLQTYYPPGKVDRVLEINAGAAAAAGIGTGSPVRYE